MALHDSEVVMSMPRYIGLAAAMREAEQQRDPALSVTEGRRRDTQDADES